MGIEKKLQPPVRGGEGRYCAMLWGMVVCSQLAVFLLLGYTLAWCLIWIHIDYLVPVSHVVARSLHAGLASGTFIAACAVVGRRRGSTLATIVRCVMVVFLATVAGALILGSGGFMLSRLGVLQPPGGFQIGSVYRFYLAEGLSSGGLIGTVVGSLWAGFVCYRQRRG